MMPVTQPATSQSKLERDSYTCTRELWSLKIDRAIAVLIFIGCLAYLWLFRHFSSLEPDEGIVLQGATRILSGQVPYSDFFSFYTPGSYYLLAGLFGLFGNSLMVARSSLAIAGALCSVITYLLSRRVCSRGMSIFAAILATAVGAAFRFLVLHNCYSTLFACIAVYSFVRLVENPRFTWGFSTGSFVALTFLFEQSKGGGLALGILLGLVLLRSAGFPNKSLLAALGTGVAWPFVLTFVYFGAHHAIGDMVSSWLWPLHHYSGANRVPYGWLNWSDSARNAIFRSGPWFVRVAKAIAISPGIVIAVLPLVAVGLLLDWAIRLRKSENNPVARYYVAVCSALSGLLFSIVIVRADILHFMYLAPLWYVVLAWILGANLQPSSMLRKARPLLVLYTAAAFGMLAFAMLLATTGAKSWIQTRRGDIKTREPDNVIEYVQAHSTAGERLLVYPYLPLYNYLTSTKSPTRFDFFQPGMNTPEQAQEMVKTLIAERTGAVLFESWFAEKFANSWPGTPLAAIANDPVGDYIVHNFRVCRFLESPDQWRFEYMVRRDMPCPTD